MYREKKECIGKREECMGKREECTQKREECRGKREECIWKREECIGKREECRGKREECTGKREGCIGKRKERAMLQLHASNNYTVATTQHPVIWRGCSHIGRWPAMCGSGDSLISPRNVSHTAFYICRLLIKGFPRFISNMNFADQTSYYEFSRPCRFLFLTSILQTRPGL
jgi:hypothetical protein